MADGNMRSGRYLVAACLALPLGLLAGCNGNSDREQLSPQAQLERALGMSDPIARGAALVDAAREHHQRKDLLGVDRALQAAEKTAAAIPDAGGQAVLLNQIAALYAEIERLAEAGDTLKQAVAASEAISDPAARIAALARSARLYGADLKKTGTAGDYLRQCESLVKQIELPRGQITSQAAIAYAYHRIGSAEDAERIMKTVQEAVAELPAARDRADLLLEIADRRRRMDQAGQFAAALEEAAQAISAIDDSLSRAHVLVDYAAKLRRGGRSDDALAALQQAEDLADGVGDLSMRRPLLDKIYAERSRN